MINLMNENSLTELEIEKEGMRIRLKKGGSGNFDRAVEYISPQAAPTPQGKPATASEKADKRNTVDVKAPMVGTFYRSPSPEAPAYVNIGDVIEPGQVICIVEAMKLMNEIKSEAKGKIVDILVENAQPVEYGHVLFLIEPA